MPPKRQSQLFKNVIPNFFLTRLKKKKVNQTSVKEKLQFVINEVKEKNNKKEKKPIIKRTITELLKKINKRIKFMKEEKIIINEDNLKP